MKKGRGLFKITSMCICAVLLLAAVPAASFAEVVSRAANAAAVAPGAPAAESHSMKAAEGQPAADGAAVTADAEQVRALMRMRAGEEDDDEKKAPYYWTSFYFIGTAILVMVLLGST